MLPLPRHVLLEESCPLVKFQPQHIAGEMVMVMGGGPMTSLGDCLGTLLTAFGVSSHQRGTGQGTARNLAKSDVRRTFGMDLA